MVIQNYFRHACGTVPLPVGFVLLFILSAAFLMPARGQELNKNLRESEEIAKPEGVKVGVALCGGSATGYAHLGFLQALQDADVKIDCVSGTSMGAIVGMFYAAGYSPRQIVRIIKQEQMVKRGKIFRFNMKKDGGLADFGRMRRIIAKYIPHNSFDSLLIPFYCCVTDINHLRPVYVSKGDLLKEYVTASASIPGVFAPVMIDSVYYVDGFVMNNLPVEPLVEEGCNVRLGLYIEHDTVMERIDNPAIIASRAMNVNSDLCTIDHLPLCTHSVAIKVHGLGKMDFDKIDTFFEYGYQAGVKFLADLARKGQSFSALVNGDEDIKRR